MTLTLNLSDEEAALLNVAAERHDCTSENMALAFIRDHLVLESLPIASRRHIYRDADLHFTPLTNIKAY